MEGYTEINRVFNGWEIVIETEEGYIPYKYIVWQYSQAEVITDHYKSRGQTPTDAIEKAIELLKQYGCMRLPRLRGLLGISVSQFIAFNQAEPLAHNVIKQDNVYVWLRGSFKGHSPADSNPIGVKTDIITPSWNRNITAKTTLTMYRDNIPDILQTQVETENQFTDQIKGPEPPFEGYKRCIEKRSEFHSIIDEILELHEKKDNDYAGGEELANFKEAVRINSHAWYGAFIRLQDKYVRCCNLISGVERKVNDESFEDTLQDLASYSIIVLALYRKWKRGEISGPENKESYGEKED